jgi:multidrug efflux pump
VFATFFIRRPIFAAVLSILITLGGGVGLLRLPVALYPEITPPTIEVSAIYPGAHARTMADTVAAPIEELVNGVEDMMYLSSTSANDGTYALTVTFKPGTNLDLAQVLVQNRVNVAAPKLPAEVRRRGVTVKKKAAGTLMIVNLASPDATRGDLYLSNYATIQLRDELARLDGVGDIQFLGQRDYSMRVWVNPIKLADRGLSAEDVTKAIEQQNAQVAAGQIGQPPVPTGQAFQFTINTRGRLVEPKEFEEIVLKTDDDGRAVRMKDVTDRIELGAAAYDQTCTLDGRPSVALSIFQLPGTNAIETAKRVRAKMAELRDKFPAGMEYEIVYDTTPFIEESVREVFVTLRDAVILVAVVMLVFLQSWRTALIPLAAVPVAIVGTFGFMALAGFSLNTLTLFGLVLAVGIVVDDAIVVVEAVESHLGRGLDAKAATAAALGEVAGPVIAVGLVLSAVFVPCVFITGIVGEFFRQFAVTIAISTLLSAFNSLTLSPALCGLLLKPHPAGHVVRDPLPRIAIPLALAAAAYFLLTPHVRPFVEGWMNQLPPPVANALEPVRPWAASIAAVLVALAVGWLLRVLVNRALGYLFWAFNKVFDVATAGYLGVVRGLLWVSPLVLVLFGGLVWATWQALATTPAGFIPTQDKGYLIVNLQLTDSASLTRTEQAVKAVDAIARSTPGVSHTVAVAGQSAVLGGNVANAATVYVMLDDFPHRRDPSRRADAVAAVIRRECEAAVPRAVVTVFPAPPVDGLGAAGGLRLLIADRDGADETGRSLQAVADRVLADAADSPLLTGVFGGYRADTPWVELKFDREAAESAGVEVADVIRALQQFFGSEYVNDFNRFGRTWQVTVQAAARFRNGLNDLSAVRVPNRRTGEMVPVRKFFKVEDTFGPALVLRFNLHPVAPVTVTPAAGVSDGEAMAELERIAAKHLDFGLSAEWTELARLRQETNTPALSAVGYTERLSTAALAFAFSVVLVFLVLAAQYESWALPLAVILVVPLCLLSAVVGVRLAGHDLNIFTQIGFVVLVGLASKNAILIVEFARHRHQAGATIRQATVEACRLRLRPIVMTSVAFILGVVPLVVAEGAGAEMRNTLGAAVFAGMIGVTAFGVFLTPVFYFVIQWAVDRIRPSPPGARGVSANSSGTPPGRPVPAG